MREKFGGVKVPAMVDAIMPAWDGGEAGSSGEGTRPARLDAPDQGLRGARSPQNMLEKMLSPQTA
jgi:hypothetical protein